MWLTDLAKLADPKYGLTVVFEPGWRTRGASGGDDMRGVYGALWHHDVSPRSGTYPLRNMLKNGRPGLTGPLAHIGFDRDGVVHVIGAGKANHAGTGKVPGVVRNGGNTRLLGIEMTSAGTRPWDWTGAQLREMPKLGYALGDIFNYGPDENWAHYEYSDGGKIDPAGLPGAMPGLRSRIAAASGKTHYDASRPWRSSPRVAGMSDAEVREIQQTLLDLGYDLGHWGADGSYGDATGRAVQALQQDLDITADGIFGPGTEKEMASIKAIVTENQQRINAARDEIDWVRRVAEVNQRRIDTTIDQTGPITRDGKLVSLRQEVADGKTLGLAAEARDQAILHAVQDAATSGRPVDLDAVTAAAEKGVSAALASIEADVTVTVAAEDTEG